MKLNSGKGFTLIELMIVVVIVGILSAIAIPRFTAIKERANEASCRSNMRQLANAEEMYYGLAGTYCPTGDLAFSGVLDNADVLLCPTARMNYTIASNATGYTVPCPRPGTGHGSMAEGIASWQ